MHPIIQQIIKTVKSQEKQSRQDAITYLSCILEAHAWNLTLEEKKSRFGSYVPEEVLEVEPDTQTLSEIIKFLKETIVDGHEQTSEILFAIGKAPAQLGLLPMIQIFAQCINGFNENEFYQGLIALERLAYFDESLSPSQVMKTLDQQKMAEHIAIKVLSLGAILHPDLEGTALRVLARVTLTQVL
jgi:hypothetical protein